MLNRRPRRQMNQMNVVPYIDVMLVLLVIFMVTAPMFTPGVIEVPSVSQATSIDTRPLEVTVDAQGKIQLIDNDRKTDVASVADLAVQIQALARPSARWRSPPTPTSSTPKWCKSPTSSTRPASSAWR